MCIFVIVRTNWALAGGCQLVYWVPKPVQPAPQHNERLVPRDRRGPGFSSSTQQPRQMSVWHQACLPAQLPAVRELDQDPLSGKMDRAANSPLQDTAVPQTLTTMRSLCPPYIKNKNTTGALPEKWGVTSCLRGSHLVPFVRCAGFAPWGQGEQGASP